MNRKLLPPVAGALATIALGWTAVHADLPRNGGLGNNAPRRLSSDYTPIPAGEYRPAPVGQYRPAPARLPEALRGVADDAPLALPPKTASKTPADPPAPAAPLPDRSPALGPQIMVEGASPGTGTASPGPSQQNGAEPYPVKYPESIVGSKKDMAEIVTRNRANEPAWYHDWRCRQWGYYPTQWRAWPAGWHEARNLQPGPHPYDIGPPELPDPDDGPDPLPPRSSKLRKGKDAEKPPRPGAREPDPLPKGSAGGKSRPSALDFLREAPKSDALKK